MTRLFSKKSWLVGAVITVLLSPIIMAGVASANYVENNLIDDKLFLDAASMNQQQIQTFLTARGGKLATYSAYSDRDSKNVSAAQIIYEAAQDFGISPKVILATLQKEESVVTDPNPDTAQLNFSMGYGCYDATGCSSYYGFYHQVAGGTWQLRFNFERASGNTTWWNPNLGFACSGSSRYYKPGLWVGNKVTFYDDAGTAYKTFTINNASTSSLYCYTPHAYPGSTAQYYSGSYNFVQSYESWFGSTQPDVEVSSPLRVSGLPEGVFTGSPTTVSFDMVNNTSVSKTVSVTVCARGPSGENLDYPLKSITIAAHGSTTYSAAQTFSAEGTYTFSITSYVNGSWNGNYPESTAIDNARSQSVKLQSIPTIISGVGSSVSDMRLGRTSNISFSVHNNSASPINPGVIAVAMRDPAGANVDLPPVTTGSIAAGATYNYVQTFTPQSVGTYNGFIIDKIDSSHSWNDSTFPKVASGASRTIQFTAKPSPTQTVGLISSIAKLHIGQSATLSFAIKNYSSNSVNLGYIGLMGRSPKGTNVDPGVVSANLAAGEERAFSFPIKPSQAGNYVYQIISTKDYKSWASGPVGETNSINKLLTINVLANPTLSQGPTLSVATPRVGQQVAASFKVKNYADNQVYPGLVGMAIRDPQGRNVDAGSWNVAIATGAEYSYQANKTFSTPGLYTAWITSYHNGHWDDFYPASDSSGVQRSIKFTVKPSPTITGGLVSNISSPQVGQTAILSFKVKNFGSSSVSLGYIGMSGRSPSGSNIDPGVSVVSLAAGEEKTISYPVKFNLAGTYHFGILSTTDFKSWSGGPTSEDGTINKTLSLSAIEVVT